MSKHRGHNEGTIFERTVTRKDGTKVTRYTALLPMNERGKRASLGTYKTRTEAREALTAAAVAKAQGLLVIGKAPTVKVWCETWLAGRSRIAYQTRRAYQRSFQNVHPYIGHIRLDKLTETDIVAMWTKLAKGEDADGQRRPPLAATTLDLHHRHLNAALRAAVRSRHVPLSYNPASSEEAKPEKGQRKSINPLTEDEVRCLFETTRADREYPLWVTLITTGIRHCEAHALRWQDIDFQRHLLSVRHGLHLEAGSGYVLGETKTRKARTIDLRPQTIAVLRAHKIRQAEMRLRAGELWHDDGFVFGTETGRPLDQRFIQRSFDRACQRAGIARRTVKETRHTFATLGLVHNVPVKIISEALGHATVAITLDIYSHVIAGLQEGAMSHLDRLFAG